MITQILRVFLFLFVCHLFLSCKQNKTPVSCGENAQAEKLFVFVGEKIEVKELSDEPDITDLKFSARYKVLEKICGSFKGDTIEFIGYDHYGMPGFSEYNTVLLCVTQIADSFYHEKYTYLDVYKTKDGRWAGPPTFNRLLYTSNSENPLAPEKIEYANEISFDVTGMRKREIKKWYAEQYFTVKGNKATTDMGNYATDLFYLLKKTRLRQRGYYDITRNNTLKPNEDIEIEPIDFPIIKAKDSLQFLASFQEVLKALNNKDIDRLKQLSLESIVFDDDSYPDYPGLDFDETIVGASTFFTQVLAMYPKSTFQQTITTKTPFVTFIEYPTRVPRTFKLKNNVPLILYTISFPYVRKSSDDDFRIQGGFSFIFVKIDDVFYLYQVS